MKAIRYAIGGMVLGAIGGTYFSIWIISNVIATAICKKSSEEKVEELTNAMREVKAEDVIEVMDGVN